MLTLSYSLHLRMRHTQARSAERGGCVRREKYRASAAGGPARRRTQALQSRRPKGAPLRPANCACACDTRGRARVSVGGRAQGGRPPVRGRRRTCGTWNCSRLGPTCTSAASRGSSGPGLRARDSATGRGAPPCNRFYLGPILAQSPGREIGPVNPLCLLIGMPLVLSGPTSVYIKGVGI